MVTLNHTQNGVADEFIDAVQHAVDEINANPISKPEGAVCVIYLVRSIKHIFRRHCMEWHRSYPIDRLLKNLLIHILMHAIQHHHYSCKIVINCVHIYLGAVIM